MQPPCTFPKCIRCHNSLAERVVKKIFEGKSSYRSCLPWLTLRFLTFFGIFVLRFSAASSFAFFFRSCSDIRKSQSQRSCRSRKG